MSPEPCANAREASGCDALVPIHRVPRGNIMRMSMNRAMKRHFAHVWIEDCKKSAGVTAVRDSCCRE